VKHTLIVGLLALSAASTFAQNASRPQQVAAANPATATPGTATATASTARVSQAHVLTREELDKLLARPQNLLVIDVRRPDEVSTIGGLPVYLSIQLNDLEKSLAWIPKGRTIITVSNHAKRAGTAADLLASKGFKVAGAVGVQTYEEAGGKLTKVAPPPPKSASAPPSG
jgi:rhodanese-related sulfurtransferase